MQFSDKSIHKLAFSSQITSLGMNIVNWKNKYAWKMLKADMNASARADKL